MFHFIFFKKNKADKVVHPLTRFWAKIITMILLVRLKKHKNDKLNKKQQYIYVANHRSMLDIPFTSILIPGHFRFLAKSSLLKAPLFGKIVRGICITVDRQSLRDKSLSFDKMKETLNQGSSVLVFPEGTRSSDDIKLNNFQNGAFKLSIETNTPIVVLTLWNSSSILKKNEFWEMKPGKVDCFISKPITGITDIEELKNKTFSIINNNIDSVEKRINH